MLIRKFSHHFEVTEVSDPTDKLICAKFGMRFAEYGITADNPSGITRMYATSNSARTEFRFHINSFNDFIQQYRMYDTGLIRLKIVEVPMYKPVKVDYRFKKGAALQEPQVPFVDFIMQPGRTKLIGLQTGGGKAQPLYSKIKIPGGWTTMGDVKVGDYVSTPDGGKAKVLGVFPQGIKDIYEITFADGRKTRACGEHLWEHFDASQPKEDMQWSIMNTLEMKSKLERVNKRSYVRLIKSEDIKDVELPIDPYLLGALLGDGGFSWGIYFSTADDEMLDHLAKVLPANISFKRRHKKYDYNLVSSTPRKNELRDIIVDLKLDVLGHEKFVPEMYLHASTRQRLAILQGLMDTDGTVNDHHVVSFCSTSINLAKAVQYLVRSLGGNASISTRKPTYTYKGVKKEGREAYQVNIRYAKSSELFRLTRKKERCNDMGQYASRLKSRVKSIEFVGCEEAQCIMVDHPEHLYITDDFIVTHNTFLTLWAIKELGVRAVIVLKGGYIERWLPDLIGENSLMGLKKEEVRVIRGLGSMMQLCLDAVNGEVTESVIIFSTDTLRMYQDHYFAMNGDMQIYSGIPPYALMEALGAGVKVVDEVHQLFHANFRTDLYTHIPLTISLSATMVAGHDRFKQFLYDTMFPKNTRADPGKYNKYIEMYALMYNLDYKSKTVLRWNRKGTSDYSQNEFEKSILKNAKVRERYINMITSKLNEYYVTKRTSNEKCLVFAGTVDMCSVMVTHMRKLWPKLKINKYTSEDEYSVIAEADIIVSTVGSLGTAHDIPDLWQVHKTVGLGKEDTNLQVAGRLRVLKNFPGRTPLMYYWTCEDIDKHMRYHRVKQELFKERVLKLGVLYTGLVI